MLREQLRLSAQRRGVKIATLSADWAWSYVQYDSRLSKWERSSELPADLIVFATGSRSMNGWVAQLISQEVADKVGKCWGLGSDTGSDPGPEFSARLLEA